MLKVDPTNPADQALAGRLRTFIDEKSLRASLLDWITYHNLPFEIVDSQRFRRVLMKANPVLEKTIPCSRTLVRLLEDEYEKAIGPVTEALRAARGQIHFAFDGWTSDRNSSFLGVNAHFIDTEWQVRSVLLGLPSLRNRHTGEALANEVADVLTFWGIDEKYVSLLTVCWEPRPNFLFFFNGS